MDQRKLIQHGPSSLTIAIPKKWLDQRNLKKGDTLFTNQEGNKVIFSTQESLSLDKIEIDLNKLDRTSLLLYIQSLYRFGYNEIDVTFPITAMHYRKNAQVPTSKVIHDIVNRCMGFEIIDQKETSLKIKYMGKEEGEDFKAILRRAFLLINETSVSLLEGIKNNDKNLINSIEEKHDNINKFVNYALRLLNKYGYPDVKKTSFYYHIIASLDKIVDVLKYNARSLEKYNKQCKKETIDIWSQINESIRNYYELFYSFDLIKIDQLSKNRDHVKNNLQKYIKKIPQEELILLTKMTQILEIILDLTDFRMGLEY